MKTDQIKAIFYRNMLINTDSFLFLGVLSVVLIVIKNVFSISNQIFFFIELVFIIYVFQRNLILNFIEDKIYCIKIYFRI